MGEEVRIEREISLSSPEVAGNIFATAVAARENMCIGGPRSLVLDALTLG